MLYALLFAVGVFIGSIIHYAFGSSGTLRIDHRNPEKDVYRIEIDNLDNLAKKRRVVLKVDNHADLSQK